MTNDDEVCIPRLSSILLAVYESRKKDIKISTSNQRTQESTGRLKTNTLYNVAFSVTRKMLRNWLFLCRFRTLLCWLQSFKFFSNIDVGFSLTIYCILPFLLASPSRSKQSLNNNQTKSCLCLKTPEMKLCKIFFQQNEGTKDTFWRLSTTPPRTSRLSGLKSQVLKPKFLS